MIVNIYLIYTWDLKFIHIKENQLNYLDNITRYIKLDTNIYICSSNTKINSLDFNNTIIFMKSYKYYTSSQYNEDILNYIENNINGKNNIHYIGRYLSIDACINYIENHCNILIHN
jgi:hypothetical protein